MGSIPEFTGINVEPIMTIVRILCMAVFPSLALFAGNTTTPKTETLPDNLTGIFQVSTFNRLAKGRSTGLLSIKELMKRGTFGVGTFDQTEGEMIAVDGKAYHISQTGAVTPANPSHTTPFAVVVPFTPLFSHPMQRISGLNALEKSVKGMITNTSIPHAIRIDGEFLNLRLRSVRKSLPNTPLSKDLKDQPQYRLSRAKGTIVGYVFPPSLAGTTDTSGPHFHFINEERTVGGHVLDLAVMSAHARFQPCHTLTIYLASEKEEADNQ
ncbi:MAG: acetolactate decarboxylase [Simkaniaceae bacterium]|nr:acetolactate decarboxylase [Simkaniaceae bacterium]